MIASRVVESWKGFLELNGWLFCKLRIQTVIHSSFINIYSTIECDDHLYKPSTTRGLIIFVFLWKIVFALFMRNNYILENPIHLFWFCMTHGGWMVSTWEWEIIASLSIDAHSCQCHGWSCRRFLCWKPVLEYTVVGCNSKHFP